MIRVEYKKKDNYPHDRKTLLFDRSAFQHTHRDILSEINKKYNILCPQVFVMECLAPENSDKKSDEELEKDKKSLREKLELIENPIVLTGYTHRSPVIEIPLDSSYTTFLTSERIAKNCITKSPIVMEGVTPEKLISHYEPRIDDFKCYIKSITEMCDAAKGMLTPNKISSDIQQIIQPMLKMLNMTVSVQEIKAGLRRDKRTAVKQTLSHAAEKTLRDIENETMAENIVRLKNILHLTDVSVNILRRDLTDRKRLTVENYPHLAYPIYIYYLFNYVPYARQINAEHLDRSYLRDFRYLHYLNFCDIFVVNERSTPYIVESLPYSDIREIPVITVRELRKSLA